MGEKLAVIEREEIYELFKYGHNSAHFRTVGYLLEGVHGVAINCSYKIVP